MTCDLRREKNSQFYEASLCNKKNNWTSTLMAHLSGMCWQARKSSSYSPSSSAPANFSTKYPRTCTCGLVSFHSINFVFICASAFDHARIEGVARFVSPTLIFDSFYLKVGISSFEFDEIFLLNWTHFKRI